MAKPYSEDLRERVVAAVEGGLSRRRAAGLFALGISTVVHWVRRFRETGSVAAKPMGGDHRSRLTVERIWLLERIEVQPEPSPCLDPGSRSGAALGAVCAPVYRARILRSPCP